MSHVRDQTTMKTPPIVWTTDKERAFRSKPRAYRSYGLGRLTTQSTHVKLRMMYKKTVFIALNHLLVTNPRVETLGHLN